jgi:hypothetical protein
MSISEQHFRSRHNYLGTQTAGTHRGSLEHAINRYLNNLPIGYSVSWKLLAGVKPKYLHRPAYPSQSP